MNGREYHLFRLCYYMSGSACDDIILWLGLRVQSVSKDPRERSQSGNGQYKYDNQSNKVSSHVFSRCEETDVERFLLCSCRSCRGFLISSSCGMGWEISHLVRFAPRVAGRRCEVFGKA